MCIFSFFFSNIFSNICQKPVINHAVCSLLKQLSFSTVVYAISKHFFFHNIPFDCDSVNLMCTTLGWTVPTCAVSVCIQWQPKTLVRTMTPQNLGASAPPLLHALKRCLGDVNIEGGLPSSWCRRNERAQGTGTRYIRLLCSTVVSCSVHEILESSL